MIGGDVADEVVEACGVGFAFGDDPVQRVALADDDRPKPRRRRFGGRVVRGAVERPVFDRHDGACAVVARERELDSSRRSKRDPCAERLERADRDPFLFAETADPLLGLAVDGPTGSSFAHFAEWSTTRFGARSERSSRS